ncbi:FtsX-like permease family protein [Aquabacterium lacunae]|uniref:FtsX-like permease family protein n=1 Tax=Aquabacterium lacunae TaxID=2528630 RepID=A0A4Q9H0A1_9BURK|nr:FtsX-like permease family protein [Aquabacterium lacunae]TBO32528.1 FtsX-like permease family protein [Aquabacterium lacunae]
MLIRPWVWRMVWRDLRSGALRWLWMAVALAVAALSAVSLFADRIERGITRDAAQLLGADLVVLGDQPLPPAVTQQARQAGLRVAETAVFPSMARAPDEQGGETRLVAVKAVGEGYPLRGRLTLGRVQPDGTVKPAGPAPAGGPPSGSVWLDPAVLQGLGLKLGDSLWLGDARFRIDAVIASEPDRGAGFVSFSPRVMLRQADLAVTRLIQPASRVTWRVLVAGPARATDAQPATPATASGANAPAALQQLAATLRQQAEQWRGVRVETLDDGRPEMRSTIDRAGMFLRLVALLAALLAAVVVATVARDFAQQRLDDCALLRVMGVSQGDMVRAYALELLLVGLGASLLGLALGGAFHQVFVWMLADLVNADLPWPGPWPAVLSVGVGLVLTLGFGLPPLLQLARVPALRVLRRQLGAPRVASVLVLGSGVAALALLLTLVVRDLKLAGIALGGVAAAVLVLSGVAAGLLALLKRWLASASALKAPLPWRQAVRGMVAQPVPTVVQVASLSLGLLALFLLILIRTDLVASWRNATPPDAPNRFVINIQPDQVDGFQGTLKEAGVGRFDWYPMIRGRLVRINGQEVKPSSFTEDRARRLVDREFNLSVAEQAPGHNEVVQGTYRQSAADKQDGSAGQGEWSVEEGLMKTLGLKLGDRLSFDVAGQVSEGRITSVRKVDWGSMRVNFFVMAPVARVEGWPETYIAAFRIPEGTGLDRALVQRFPNVTVVDVTMSINQVQGVLTQVIAAVEFLFLFTLSAGVLVLLAGLWSSRERRAAEWAIMRSLGASREQLARIQRLELAGVGLLSGGLAAAAAIAIGGVLAAQVFEFAWAPPWWGPVAGGLAGMALVMLAGWWSLRGLLNRPVLAMLRQQDA